MPKESLATEVVSMRENIKHIKEGQVRIERSLKEFIKKADTTYETKEGVAVYKRLTWVIVVTLLTGVIGIIFYIFK